METAESTASTGEAPRAPIALFKKRGAKAEGSFRKRQATPPPAGSDSDDSDFSSDSESGRRLKRRKKSTGTVFATSTAQTPSSRDLTATVFEADRSVAITSSNDATKQSNWHTEDLDDASSSKNPPSAQIPDGTYKGLAHQTSFIQKNPNAPDRKFGPIKAATNIRTITVTDYAPEVCKDFKTSGFVALLDREWESVTKGKKNLGGTVVASANRDRAEDDDDGGEEEAMLENIPFACVICKESYNEPVVTRCGHYFCESCALKRYRKDPSCAACGAGTGGVFNTAKRLKKLLDKKREWAARKRQQAIDAGEEVSEGDEDA